MDEINKDISDFVKDYAKQNGYTQVLGTTDQTKTILYGDAKSDITAEIIEVLNTAYRKDSKESIEVENDSLK